MADYSAAYFSLNKAEPQLLPRRFRLASGATRYANDVSLADVNSLGYTGPYTSRPDSSNELAAYYWDPNQSKFVEQTFTDKEDKHKNEWVFDSGSNTFKKQAKDSVSILNLETSLMNDIRAKRDIYLRDTDWTQLADVNFFLKKDFKAYRTLLRDLPTSTDIWNIEFPARPSSKASDYGKPGVTQPVPEEPTKTGYYEYDTITGELKLIRIVADSG